MRRPQPISSPAALAGASPSTLLTPSAARDCNMLHAHAAAPLACDAPAQCAMVAAQKCMCAGLRTVMELHRAKQLHERSCHKCRFQWSYKNDNSVWGFYTPLTSSWINATNVGIVIS